MANEDVAANFLAYAAKRMKMSQKEITRCTEQLSEEQMHHRGGDYENSIANLLMHLAGNIRQWIQHGIDEQPDVRERDAEFSLTPEISASEALQRFNTTVDEAVNIIAALPPERLSAIVDPQPTSGQRHLTILEAIFRIVGHLQMHTGQIILLTKQLLATDLDFTLPRKR